MAGSGQRSIHKSFASFSNSRPSNTNHGLHRPTVERIATASRMNSKVPPSMCSASMLSVDAWAANSLT
jgi:hypothetical protein